MKIQRIILIIHRTSDMQEELDEAIRLRYPELIGKELIDIDPKIMGSWTNGFIEYHVFVKYEV